MGLVQTVTSVGTLVALTTTILVPALIGLRDRNRQAVCTTRIGLLTRAMLLYADDYNETPPFMGLGWENIHYDDEPDKDLGSTAGAPNDIPTKSRWGWAVAETWVTQHPELLWNGTLQEAQWDANGVGVRTGLLWPYTRSEALYRCPEFERIPNKSQSAFNYTRTLWGRKWILSEIYRGGPEPDHWGGGFFGSPGPIMRTSQVHKPALLPMMYDEWWLRHVGSDYLEHIPPRPRDANLPGGWMAVDCIHFPLGDEIGQYHGRPVRSDYFPAGDPLDRDPKLVQRGTVAFYDGHTGLERQFWVRISERAPAQIYWNLQTAVLPFFDRLIFAARGIRTLPY